MELQVVENVESLAATPPDELDAYIESLYADKALGADSNPTNDLQSRVAKSDDRTYDYLGQFEDIYRLPKRDWESLINLYNKTNIKIFPFTSLECRSVVYYVAQNQFPIRVFKAMGVSSQKYNTYKLKSEGLESAYTTLDEQDSLTPEERKQLSLLKLNALRLFFQDIERAESIAHLIDIDDLNAAGKKDSNVLIQKVRTKYKEFQGNEKDGGNATNIQIVKLGGGDWLNGLLDGE